MTRASLKAWLRHPAMTLLPTSPLFSAFTAGVFAASLVAPWWVFVALSFLFSLCYFWIRASKRSKDDLRHDTRVGVAVALVWLIMALIRDIPSGFRISYRLGSIIGVPHSILFYPMFLLAIGILASLASSSGRLLAEKFKDPPADIEAD